MSKGLTYAAIGVTMLGIAGISFILQPTGLTRGTKMELVNVPAKLANAYDGCEVTFIAQQQTATRNMVFVLLDNCTNAPPDMMPVVDVIPAEHLRKLQ